MNKLALITLILGSAFSGLAMATDGSGEEQLNLNAFAHNEWQYLGCTADHNACHHLAGHNGYHHAMVQGTQQCLAFNHHAPYACYGRN
jgi:hypothetical protein